MNLRFKIVGAFALIVLASLALSVFIGMRTLRTRFTDFDRARDAGRARTLAPLLAPSLGADPRAVVVPTVEMPGGSGFDDPRRMKPGTTRGLMMPEMMSRMMGRDFSARDFDEKLLLTDPDGRVLLDAADFGRDRLSRDSEPGIPVYVEEDLAGYLYVGSMIPGENRRPEEGHFVRSVGAGVTGYSILIFLVAVAVGMIVSAHIVRPVKRLEEAARRVGAGELSVRVPENRRDELGALARGFNAMATSLGDSEEQRRRLIADAAHELRTPVSLIRARIEMMEEGIYAVDASGLASLADEAHRLTNLVEELRSLADLESAAGPTQFTTVSITPLLEGAVEAVRPETDRKDLDITLRVEDGLPELTGDPGKLRQVLANLLSNAIRYAGSRIHIRAFQADADGGIRGVRIVVEDDGPGIPEEEREKVFRRFYRRDKSRSRDTGGSGLGLAICRRIVLDHGGSIVADRSEKLAGAAFLITLPTAGADGRDPEAERT